jgi:RNA polymerase sigma-70 factor (ECF subfamily)
LVFAYGRRRGLQDADAADLVQQVLAAVAAAAGRFAYDPARGSFRGWLLAVARNELRLLLRLGRRHAAAVGGTTHLALLAGQPGGADDSADREHRERLFLRAAGRVRGSFRAPTWEAFWRTAVLHQPAEAVARDLGLSVGAVYIARSRVLARLRQAVAADEEGLPPAPRAAEGEEGSRDDPGNMPRPGGARRPAG